MQKARRIGLNEDYVYFLLSMQIRYEIVLFWPYYCATKTIIILRDFDHQNNKLEHCMKNKNLQLYISIVLYNIKTTIIIYRNNFNKENFTFSQAYQNTQKVHFIKVLW